MRAKLCGEIKNYGTVILGSAVFALGFNLFLAPNLISAGGLSGASLLMVHLLGFGSVGVITAILNVPLFVLGWRLLGKRFFVASLVGMASSSFLLDAFSLLPAPETEPLLGALAGGLASGFGIGLVFSSGATTGGADMIARLLRTKARNLPMGRLIFLVDLVVVVLTGVVFRDINKTMYSALTLYVSSLVVDHVLYGPDHSTVALIISPAYETIAKLVGEQLQRGATVLPGQGSHTGRDRPVLLCAVKKRQIAALKALIRSADPDAFVILQEAHQVLGSGFKSYAEDEL